jgi:hypothetical protein
MYTKYNCISSTLIFSFLDIFKQCAIIAVEFFESDINAIANKLATRVIVISLI